MEVGEVYLVIVFLTATVHLAFLIYVVVGGFIAVRWIHTIWLHLLAALWGISSVALHLLCPLTLLEQWGRNHAGMPPLPSTGFIDHYIAGVVYPLSWSVWVQVLVFVTVAASWLMFVATGLQRSSQRRNGPVGHRT
jgi:hypothetical protein